MKQIVFKIVLLLAINILFAFVILPWGQSTANSHMNAGPFFGKLSYFIAVFIMVFAFYKYNGKTPQLILVLFTAVSFAFWGYKLLQLVLHGLCTQWLIQLIG